MKAIVTRVTLKPGTADAVAALFEGTNPALVRDWPQWRGARMLIDRARDEVTVIAIWTSEEAYRAFAATDDFRQTMARFAGHFAAPPEVRVTDVAVEMTPEGVRG